MDPSKVTTRQEIHEHMERVVSSAPFRGSPAYAALLRYLVESSLNDQTRHEIDVAIDVFGKDQSYDPAVSSAVRVRVHQLRKKLDEYYRSAPDVSAIRFSIPKGSYRIAFGTEHLIPAATPKESARSDRLLRLALAAVSALLLVSAGANMLLLSRRENLPPAQSGQPLAANFAWQAVTEGPEPILIVLGDFFVFREAGEEGRIRFIRDIEINSRADLSGRVAEPEAARPADLTYLPKSTAFTLEAILPVVQATGKPVSLKLMSEVTGEDLREHDVIYIGFIRSMGVLQDYFFRASSFLSPHPFVDLHDKKTGEVFAASDDSSGYTHDYGLFAKIPGPGSGDVLIFTGIRDIGILHAVRALTEPDRARALADQIGSNLEGAASPIEILFDVSGYHRTDLQAKVVRAGRAASDHPL
jgi:hypothetical protein